MDCCITSLSSHTRFYPSQHTLHECLSSCTSWHSRFSNLIAFLSVEECTAGAFLPGCRITLFWFSIRGTGLTFPSFSLHFSCLSLVSLSLWLRADPSNVQAPVCLLSCRWWLLLSEPQVHSPSCQSSGRSWTLPANIHEVPGFGR